MLTIWRRIEFDCLIVQDYRRPIKRNGSESQAKFGSTVVGEFPLGQSGRSLEVKVVYPFG